MPQHGVVYLLGSLIMMNDWQSLLSLVFCPKMCFKIITSRCFEWTHNQITIPKKILKSALDSHYPSIVQV